jgi:transcriptional regulator GlxA family with amidase domain
VSVGGSIGPRQEAHDSHALLDARVRGARGRAGFLTLPHQPSAQARGRPPAAVAEIVRHGTLPPTLCWTTSVCTGSLLLGAAGLLDGLRATTHWLELETLAGAGAEPTQERVVPQGRIVTAAGVSSGIDMALWLAGRIAGDDVARAIQLLIGYDPQPPYDSGSTAKAAPELTAFVRDAVAQFR